VMRVPYIIRDTTPYAGGAPSDGAVAELKAQALWTCQICGKAGISAGTAACTVRTV
jgi:hypothetical protein